MYIYIYIYIYMYIYIYIYIKVISIYLAQQRGVGRRPDLRRRLNNI